MPMRRRQLRRWLLRAGALCGALTLSACSSLGPDFQKPGVSWLNDWQSANYPRTGGADSDAETGLHFWWRQFNDPVLDRLVQLAKQENPSLRIAGLRILESRAMLGIAGSALYPQVQQTSGGVSYLNSRQSGPGDTSQVGYQLGFNLAWELDFWGRFQRAIESADAGFFASVANQQDAQVLLSAQVASLYFAYRTTVERIRITHKNVAIQKRSLEITDNKFKGGQQSELDFQQARTQYLATLATVPQMEQGLRNTRNALCILLGRPPSELPELESEDYRLPDIGSAVFNGIPADLLTRRPDVRAAAWAIAAQSAQIGIAEADYYPAISLLGSLGWSGSSLSAVPNVGSLAIGPAVRWNLFDHGLIANNIRSQDARLQQSIENYQNTVLLAAREVDDAAVGITKTAEQETVLDESVEAAQRALDIANTRYREGYADFERVLSAQRSLASQEEKQLLNHGSHLSYVVDLYKSLGGGWQTTSIDRLIPDDTRRTMSDRSDWGALLTAPLPDEP